MENGNATENGHGVTNGESTTVHMDYSTDFPSLPVSIPNGASSSQRAKMPLPVLSKNSTLTFVLSPAERSSRVKSALGNQQSEEHKRCALIAQATGCRIELSESKDGALTVIIQGPRHKVEDAKNQVVRGLQTQDKQQISIPKDHHRKIIGKEGAALKQLEADTNCTITIPKRDQPSDIIEIKGPAEGIRRAVGIISDISQREASQAVEHIVCPKMLYPFIRGPNNETTDKLTADFGVKINIPHSNANNEVINISGPKEGVPQAAAVIRKIIHEKERTVKELKVTVAKQQHRHIVGQKRDGIHEILRITGVYVEVPEQEEQSDNITLRGDPNKLNDALVLVLSRASARITQSIDCPLWLHKHLIGPKGATLAALVPDRDNLQIDFDEGGHIFIEGPPEKVKVAFAALDTEASRLKNEMAIEKIKVHPSLHRHVIGRGGSLISKIKEESGVQISIPNEQTNSDEITVEGKKAGVAKAVKEIKAQVAKIENEKSKDVIIEQRLHKLLIGKNGVEIGKIRSRYPNVVLSFPDANKKSDVINIRGDKNDVDAVHKELTKRAKELIEENYQESVPIFKEFHKHIIGKGGVQIKAIRDELRVRIDLPDSSSEEDKINITGKKEDVKKAVARLTSIQNELASIVTIEMEIPVKVQNRLMGGGRRLIQNIEEECGGVHIRFPPEKSDLTKVTVRGPKDDAARAEKLLSALAKDKEQNWVEDSVKAKPEFHRFLIGKGGAKINKIRESHDVRIMFPREADEDKETIHLLGKKEDVEQVKKELETAIQQLNETVEITVQVETRHHQGFLKRGAELLKKIQSECGGVVISFPRNGENETTVTIKGAKQGAEQAKSRIEELVDDFEHQVSVEVEIKKEHHGRILGPSGQNVIELQNKFNVSIRFPSRRDENVANPDLVTISGRDSNVEEARVELLALVPVKEAIVMPNGAKKRLFFRINQEPLRCFTIQTEHQVRIDAPKGKREDEDSALVEVFVSGPAANVQAALEDLKAVNQEYEDEMEQLKLKQFELQFEVPAKYRERLAGFGFSTGKAFQSKYDVNINAPRLEGAPVVTFTIKGYEEKTKECAAEMQGIIDHLESLFSQEITLDSRYFNKRLTSRSGSLNKIQDKYGVEILFVRDPADPDLVIVFGKDEDSVFDCIDHLKDEEETYLFDTNQRSRPRLPAQPAVFTPQSQAQSNVVINNAPWQMDAADFPEMGAAAPAPAQTVGGAWGGPRRW